MSDIYYQPENYGLRTIGEVEFSSGSYEFDTSVVWQDVETGALYYAHDSGCSCPIPFDSEDRSTIKKIERVQELIDHLEEVKRDQYWWHDDPAQRETWGEPEREASVNAQIGELVNKVREASRV